MTTTSNRVSGARLTQLPAWRALSQHFDQIKDAHLRQLFADDPRRGEKLAAEAVGLWCINSCINPRARPRPFAP
jgi:glucose-6-phosphate isomerase